MKNKFKSIVTNLKGMSWETVGRVALITVGSVAGLLIAGHFINEARKEDYSLGEVYYKEHGEPEIR